MQNQLPVKSDDILNQAIDKQRIVITGSRGTLTLSALIIHTLKFYNRPVDYVISTPAYGISDTSRFSDAPIIIIESNVLEMTSFKHHIGLITNILWNESEKFPSEDEFVKQFELFADSTPKGGILLYCENDPLALLVGSKPRSDVFGIGYTLHPHTSDSGKHFLSLGKDRIPVSLLGSQNYQNISGARELLKRIGITNDMFYNAISSFE